MTCDTWFEKLKLESNTTPRLLVLCWRDLISQNIDREVREELVTIFWEPMRMNSVLSRLSVNLFANMKF